MKESVTIEDAMFMIVRKPEIVGKIFLKTL